MKTEKLIASLAQDLQPAKPVLPEWPTLFLWLFASVSYVSVAIMALGPVRPGSFAELAGFGRFSFEMVLGCAAIVAMGFVALADAVPGRLQRWTVYLAWSLLLVWVLQFFLGFGYPALEPSMLGKRAHCAFESYLYSVPPVLGMIWMQRRRFPLRPVRSILHAAIAAAAIPAVWMQVACMYDPAHILAHHVLPIGVLAGVSSIVAWLFVHIRRGD